MIKPGDVVVCIEPGRCEDYDPQPSLKKGVTYHVNQVSKDGSVIYLEPETYGFYVKRFIKIEI